MKNKISYEVSYDLEVTITYIGEKEPGEYHFEIERTWADLIFDDESETVQAAVFNGKPYLVKESHLRDEEESAIKDMMTEIIK
jgi:hypothetical protein